MNELENNFEKLKKIKWQKATATFYVVKKTMKKRKAYYKVFLVKTDEELQKN